MKISCESCGANYAIADAKVLGKLVKVRCKSCGGTILVDGRSASTAPATPGESQPPKAAAPAPAPAPLAAPAPAPAPTPVAKPSAPASVPAPGKGLSDAGDDEDDATRIYAGEKPSDGVPDDPNAWSVNLSDTEQRTMTKEEVVEGYLAGKVTDDAFLWKDGMDDWVPVLEVKELREAIEARRKAAPRPAAGAAPVATAPVAAAPAPKAEEKPKAAARVAAAAAPRKDDLFGNLETAGSELDVSVTEEEAAAARAAEHERMIGARNENSVLFSLDALKAGVGAPPPAMKGPQRAAPKAPKAGALDYGAASAPVEDIMGLGGGDMGGQLMNPMGNQALLTAPAPEPEPPKPKPKAVEATTATPVAAPASKGKMIAMIGGVAALVAVALVGGMMLGNKGGKGTEVAQNTTAQPTGTGVGATPNAAVGQPPATPTGVAAAPTATPDAGAAPAAAVDAGRAADGTKKPEDKPAAVAAADAGGAKPAEKPGDKPADKPADTAAPAAGDAPPFNTGAAVSALATAASAASGCKKPDGPTGTGKATVTFAPSGRATTATISGGAFGGTPVGGCVSSVFRRAKVPAFSGSPVTVSKSFTIAP